MHHFLRNFQIFTVALFLLNVQLSHSQETRVIRGERPPIDLASISSDAWEPGVIKIKLTETASQRKSLQRTTDQEISTLGLAAVDALNVQSGATGIVETFYSPAFKARNAGRHQAWGFDRWFTLQLDESADIPAIISAYLQLDEVEIAEPEFRKRLFNTLPDGTDPMIRLSADEILTRNTNDPRLYQQWHYHNTGQQNGTPGKDIDLFAAWEIETGNSDVIVAIIDQGIQYTHPDLQGNMWPEIGFNFANNSANINPGDHGTHVGGTVSAVNNNSLGVAGVAGGTGANDGVRLMSAQVFSGNNSGGFHLAPLYAADNGAAISQNSWGYTSPNVYDQTSLDAIDYFNLNGGGEALSGGITIFAAGNDGEDALYYPGCYSGAFSVAATNNKDKRSWYSTYGDWVDISAPGGETNSVNARGVLSTVSGGGYAFFQGTSMACPHASGVAALAVSLAYGELSADDLAEILRSTTDDHYDLNPAYVGKLGTGRLNAHNVLTEAQSWLSGIQNASGFKAEALNNNEVQLSWSLNDAENPVIVAFSEVNQFGPLLDNSTYSVGDTITGGGTFLYKGSDTIFLHSNLQSATNYYYKIWAFDDTLAYSTGRISSALTDCGAMTLPFSQGFESVSDLPACWAQEIEDGPAWEIGTGNGASNPPDAHTGTKNVFFRSSNAFNEGLTSRLITPPMDMTGVNLAILSFYYTNPQRNYTSVIWQDELQVKYKAELEDDWTLLRTFDTNVTSWTEVSLILPDLSDSYYIAFEGISYSGLGISIDDIVINGEQLDGFLILAEAEGDGSIDPSGWIFAPAAESQQFNIDATIGHHISALLVDDESIAEAENQSQFMYSFPAVDTTHTIKAYFMPDVYNVAVEVMPAGAGSVLITGQLFYGKSIKLKAESSESNYQFSHWVSNGDSISSNNPFVFTLQSDTLFEAHFSLVTGLVNTLSDRIRVYPNPAHDHVYIDLPSKAFVQVFDLQGRLQFEANLPAGNKRINLSEFHQGMYVIKLQFDDQLLTRSIVRF